MRWLRAPERQAWLFTILVCASVFGIAGWRVLRARNLELSGSRITTTNLARAITEHASGVMRDADIVLSGLTERLQADGTADPALTRLHRLLEARVAGVSTLHHLVVFSAQGDALTASFDPMPPINVADRAYFAFHRDHPTSAPLVGAPIRNRADGQWSLTVSRRFDTASGDFGGVVVAVIDCDTFAQFYSSFDIGPHGVVTLLRDDTELVARYPPLTDPELRQKPLTPDARFRGLAGQGRLISPLDGVARQYSYRRVPLTPLLVFVGLSEDNVLAVWKRDAWVTLAACSAICAGLSLLALLLARQIRDRAQRQILLQRSESLYRLLADFSTDVIIHLGSDCRRRYVSPASERLFGRRPEDMLNGHPRDTTHPEDWPALEASINEIFRGGHAPPIVYRSRRQDGSYIWVETQGQKLEDNSGFIVTIRDATSRKEAEALLHSSNNRLSLANGELNEQARHLAHARDEAELATLAKTRFLAGMSHELRTPLNGILGYAHLLRLESGLNPMQASRVDAMIGAGAHLLQMINRVLDLSQVEVGQSDVQLSEIDPREVARACLDLIRPLAGNKGLTAVCALKPVVPQRITTDLTRLRQVLLNLLGNAVKFTAVGGIELRLREVPGGSILRFEVIDTGPGIPAGQRDRLFQEFQRFGTGSDITVEGAGLGLALSHRLASVMGGSLGHMDNPLGGSVFWLDLPLLTHAADTTPVVKSLSDAKPSTDHPLRVLVVDDMAMNRDIAGAFLRATGHDVVLAKDGTEAVSMADAADFDVILMDVQMPGVNGLEATRLIRKLSGARASVPIVGLTAQAFTEQVEECLRSGMDIHLAKPFTPASLAEVVARAAKLETARGGSRASSGDQPDCNSSAPANPG